MHERAATAAECPKMLNNHRLEFLAKHGIRISNVAKKLMDWISSQAYVVRATSRLRSSFKEGFKHGGGLLRWGRAFELRLGGVGKPRVAMVLGSRPRSAAMTMASLGLRRRLDALASCFAPADLHDRNLRWNTST